MRRNVSLEEISDGKLYDLNDMVKADCGDCKGCFACCRGMGESIILDPIDIYRLTENTGLSFYSLMSGRLELHVVDGLILPNIAMDKERDCCTFLTSEGRCGIHAFRPGICRLFPLGRYYENDSFQYFLQIHECPNGSRTKVKVKKWIDTPDIKKYEQYITDWHYFLAALQQLLEKEQESEQTARNINMSLLNCFFITPYQTDLDFYTQFYDRLHAFAKEHALSYGK